MTMRKNGLHGLDIAEYMPKSFVLMYLDLVERGLKSPGVQRTEDADGTSAPRKKFNEHHGGLGNEEALDAKSRVDKALRALARPTKAEHHACPSCGKRIGGTWRHCAWCGHTFTGATVFRALR